MNANVSYCILYKNLKFLTNFLKFAKKLVPSATWVHTFTFYSKTVRILDLFDKIS